MISYHAYKVLHLTAIFMIVLSFGGMAVNAVHGGRREHPYRRILALTHGFGMLCALVAGFGLLARLEISLTPWPPNWVIAKILIWLAFGGFVSAFLRKPQWSKILWMATILLTAAAAYFANYKPV